jgi:hypothetical protein
MDKPQANDYLRDFLKGFYGVLKGRDYALRFAFLTGVTKFSKVSIFSDLNQLRDISFDDPYASICGISETEFLQSFKPEIEALAAHTKLTYDQAVNEMKKRYDGYRFAPNGDEMYNPFSVLNVFESKKFGYYWFKSGTPTFLVKALKNNRYDIRKFNNNVTIAARSIDDYRANDTNLIPILYQSGYLTIKSYDERYEEYTLGYPNEEVKYGFLHELLPVYAPATVMNGSFSTSLFVEALDKGDVEGFMTQLTAFYASIPCAAIKKEHRDVQYYQHVFYLLFSLMGQFVETEVKSAVGRADAVVKTADSVYVFEFKMDESATAEDALAQIDDKGYLIPYATDHRRLVKIGVEFSAEAKGVRRWIYVVG